MEIMYLLIGVSFLMATFGIIAFLWANAYGQFRDLVRPGCEVLADEDHPLPTKEADKQK